MAITVDITVAITVTEGGREEMCKKRVKFASVSNSQSQLYYPYVLMGSPLYYPYLLMGPAQLVRARRRPKELRHFKNVNKS